MKFIRKSVVVDAVQVTGDNYGELKEFIRAPIGGNIYGTILFSSFTEENLVAFRGDWVVRLPDGEFIVCGPGTFRDEYCPVKESGSTRFSFSDDTASDCIDRINPAVDAFRIELESCVKQHGKHGPSMCDWTIQLPLASYECGDPLGMSGHVTWKLKDKHQQQEN